MSVNGQFPSPGADDWVEQIRDFLHNEPPLLDEAILESAYEASDVDTAAMFAYFEGRLSAEQRRELEAEATHSPHALRKLARVGAIIARSRGGQRPVPDHQAAAAVPETSHTQNPSTTTRRVHRVTLGLSKSAGLYRLPRPEDMLRIASDPDYELYRSREKNGDQLRIYHQSAPIGTLLAVRFLKPAEEESSRAPLRFAVLRRGSESSTTATLLIPTEFQQAEVEVELGEMPVSELGAEEAGLLFESYEKARVEDPVAITPLHAPRSAWQTWADGILKTPTGQVPPAIWELAERIAAS